MFTLVRTPRQLGTALRRARKRLDLNQSQLAELAGVSQPTVSLVETGHVAMRLDTLLALLAALDLELQVGARSKRSAAEAAERTG